MIIKSIDSKRRMMSCMWGSRPTRETKDSPNSDDDVMNSFETTGRSVGVQTAVRQKSQSTGDGYVI